METNRGDAADIPWRPARASRYDTALESSGRFVKMAMRSALADATHPLPIRRVAELDKFSKSQQYADILSGGVALD